MSWFALATRRVQRFWPSGMDGVLDRGTLLMEVPVRADGTDTVVLRHVQQDEQGRRGFHVVVSGEGRVSVVQTLGSGHRHVSVLPDAIAGNVVLRISYAWDRAQRISRLAVEQLGTFGVRFAYQPLEDPLPMRVDDLHGMIMAFHEISAGAEYMALSTDFEPIGPTPGLDPATPIATAFGYKPAGQLRRGDTVLTANSDNVPVLHVLRRRVPAAGLFRQVRLHSPYFGLLQDITVSAAQRLLFVGSEVEYNHGAAGVLVTAGHLENGISAVPKDVGPVVEYVQLVMPRNEPLIAAGSQVESVNIGRLRRDCDALSQSLLKDVPNGQLPEHSSPAAPVLDAFEAVTLAGQRVA